MRGASPREFHYPQPPTWNILSSWSGEEGWAEFHKPSNECAALAAIVVVGIVLPLKKSFPAAALLVPISTPGFESADEGSDPHSRLMLYAEAFTSREGRISALCPSAG